MRFAAPAAVSFRDIEGEVESSLVEATSQRSISLQRMHVTEGTQRRGDGSYGFWSVVLLEGVVRLTGGSGMGGPAVVQ
jgi:hypothetical protein